MAEALRNREQGKAERNVSGMCPARGKEPMHEGLAQRYKRIVLADKMEPEVIERLKALGPVESRPKGYKPEDREELIAALADAEVLLDS